MKKQLLLYFACILYSNLYSQNTIGTIGITEDAFEAFTLLNTHNNAYLINNCGEVINEWNSAYRPGNAVYLLPNGNLLRAGLLDDGSSDIVFGGQGGIVELFDWENTLIWSYTYSSNQFRQHHDIYPMPNGNVLILAATVLTEAQAIAAGRDPNFLTQTRLYNEQIIEVEPIGTDQANIVWEWNANEHLIQDFDATKANFGNVALSPERLNINFLNGGNGNSNWLHFNSIQYNEDLDQIVISSRNLSEIYIIDHSTTISESASSSGGIYGKGGDILYRWGNPQAYNQGDETDRVLYGQHYPHFIESGLEDEGKLMIFNNGSGRTPQYSEVLIIDPPASAPGVYDYVTNTAYGPATLDYSYSDQSDDPSDFYSAIVSSAQRLPNGNILICEGADGEIFEIDSNDNIVWEYINPVNNINGEISTQGGPRPNVNILFRALKYAPDFPAFTGRDLTPGPPIELNPNIIACQNLDTKQQEYNDMVIFPNPTLDVININSSTGIDKIQLFSVLGELLYEVHHSNTVNMLSYKSGIYFVQIYSGNSSVAKKIVKR
ncbi:aryl-sulfate sulfotransferase [Psychroserpens sp.]|uniref:aryl-sulfate sulfotransferase n=1 Tax=Psychroserpens sp. TaxID=2020870 RepID=UPI003C794490